MSALAYYEEAYGIRLALYEDDPESADRSFELTNEEAKRAVWHIVQKTPEHDRQALDWITRAEARLSEMQADDLCDDRPRDCRRLAASLAKNRALVQKRLDAAP